MNPRHHGSRVAFLTLALCWWPCCDASPDRSETISDADAVPVAAIKSGTYGSWMNRPSGEWPYIAMINQIDYKDQHYPVAGCGFLLDTGEEILAATAKHVLTYFKSAAMDSVAFGGTLKEWRMFPKDSPEDIVVLDRLLNEDSGEELPGRRTPSDEDWLLFTIRERSRQIQPLRLRTGPLKHGEAVFVVGWRYVDNDRPQVVHEVVSSSPKADQSCSLSTSWSTTRFPV